MAWIYPDKRKPQEWEAQQTQEKADAKFTKDKDTILKVTTQLSNEIKQMNEAQELQANIQQELTTLQNDINSTDNATVDNIQDKRDKLSLRTVTGAKEYLTKYLELNKTDKMKYSIAKFRGTCTMAAQTLLRQKGYFKQTEGQNYFTGKNKGHATEKEGKARIDGIIGKITTGAYTKFQEDYNKKVDEYNQKQTDSTKKKKKLIVDGKLGPKTIEAILDNDVSVVNNHTDQTQQNPTDGNQEQNPQGPENPTNWNNTDHRDENPTDGSQESNTEVVTEQTDKEKAKTELDKVKNMSFEDFKKEYGDPQNPNALKDLCEKAGYSSLQEYLWSNQTLKNRIESLQKLSAVDENKNLTVIKANYSKANIEQWCIYAGTTYQEWIKNYQKLDTKFQIIKMVNDATDEQWRVTNTKLKTNTFNFDNFNDTEQYRYPRIKTLKDNTLSITELYQEDENDLIGKEFKSIHSPRVQWLKQYQDTREKRINNLPEDLKNYLKAINSAFDKTLYDTNWKIKDENKDKVYIDNKDFVKAFILNNNSNNNLTNIKRIVAKLWASSNNKTTISWKKYKITLKGTNFSKSKLNPEQQSIVNWVLQSNHSQRTEIFAELCTEEETLDNNKILWWETWVTKQIETINTGNQTINTGNQTVNTFLKHTPKEYQSIFKHILWKDSQKGEQIINELAWWADGMPFSRELKGAIEDEDDYTHGILSEDGEFSGRETEKGLYSIGNLTVLYGEPLTLQLNGEEYQKVKKQDFLTFLEKYLTIYNEIHQ